MKSAFFPLTLALWLWALGVVAQPGPPSPYIRIDQFGYLPGDAKVALFALPVQGFDAGAVTVPPQGPAQVRRVADDSLCFEGPLRPWQGGAVHAQSGDRGWYFDFSPLRQPGSYYVCAGKWRSYAFQIDPAVYAGPLEAAQRMFFYQRINFPKDTAYAGAKWADGPAYAEQEYAVTSRWAKGDPTTARDLHGGWYDAGDPNKYTTFTQHALLLLLEAYRAAPAVFSDATGIPESGNGLPDLLDEVRWELDWLMRMQDATGTGGLLLKVGVDDYADVSPPSADQRPRYYYGECTSATLAGAGTFALAALVYRSQPGQAAYGQDLLDRAVQAYARAAHTTEGFTRYETACDDGDLKSGDADRDSLRQVQDAVIAAAYLYLATQDPQYRAAVEARLTSLPALLPRGWTPYSQPLLLALRAIAPELSRPLRRDLTRYVQQGEAACYQPWQAETDLYRAYLSDNSHHWGSNMVRAAMGSLLLDGGYRQAAAGYLHYLHGFNPMGMVYLTNMYAYGAEHCANEMYHTWFRDGSVWDHALDSPLGPPPGYLTGGPNVHFTGLVADSLHRQPPGKAYKDWNSGWPENSWEITEPAIYYQAAYIHLLARLMAGVGEGPDG